MKCTQCGVEFAPIAEASLCGGDTCLKRHITVDEAVLHLRKVFTNHAETYAVLRRLEATLKTSISQADRADLALVLDKVYKFLDDSRKDADRVKQLAFDVSCLVWVNTPNADRSIRGRFVTATPDVKQSPKWPSRRADPEKYDTLMRWIGVDPQSQAVSSGALTPHWVHMQELASKLVQELKPLPAGFSLSDLMTTYSMTLRQRVDPLTGELSSSKEDKV